MLCAVATEGLAQPAPATTTGNPWATGGVNAKPGAGNGGAAGPLPYWQAPALPQAVIQGGSIPAGWTPQAVPYQGLGPDGRPLTMYYAPTYVFTYQVGPPVQAPAVAVPSAVPVNRRQAAAQPASMQGWNYQTQGAAPPPAYTLPPATVARYQPTPYQFPSGARALSGTPVVPPAGQLPTTPTTTFATTSPALQPPPGQWGAGQQVAPPPNQWTRSVEPPPPGLAPQAALPAAIAGTAGAVAAATQPSAAADPALTAVAPQAASSIPAQPVSVAASSSGRSANTHLWRVVGVHDGDTVTCLDESNQQQKVRLAEIDAPEIGQEYGKVSREALAAMVFGKTVEVTDEGKDRYGRWIGHISVNGIDVNREMIATGNAWHYEDYSRDASLAALQSQAQAQRQGLWAMSNPTAPWDFRKAAGKQPAG